MMNSISKMDLNELCSKHKTNTKDEEDLHNESSTKNDSKKIDTEPKSSPSPQKLRKLSIQIPKNKDLEYKMNVNKLKIFFMN